uniref:Uncharacterized protein n=1 Tax=Alexandrium monilatum TaxID=311494 RepID=A0A7S4SYQ3_9DINO
MPRQTAGGLLAGNVSISLGADGEPQATLIHPNGGTCVVAVRGARVVSWRPAEALEERLEAEAGGIAPCRVDCVPATAWDIEPPRVGLSGEGAVVFSLFAEAAPASPEQAAAAGAAMPGPTAPLNARYTVSLWPKRLAVELDIANVAGEGEGDVSGAPPAEVAGARLHLARHGLRGCLRGGEASGAKAAGGAGGAAATEAALGALGLRLRTMGYADVAARPAMGAGGGGGGGPVEFEALAPVEVALAPGEAVSGSVTLESA